MTACDLNGIVKLAKVFVRRRIEITGAEQLTAAGFDI